MKRYQSQAVAHDPGCDTLAGEQLFYSPDKRGSLTPDLYALRLVQSHRFRGVRETAPRPTPARGPAQVFEFLKPFAEREVVEVFWILALNGQHSVIRNAPIIISTGTINQTLVHPREVFRAAIVAGAVAIVLAHNHPSGDPNPSAEDRAITNPLVAAGKLLDIPVFDHIVIGHDRYVSFAEAGLLEPPTGII